MSLSYVGEVVLGEMELARLKRRVSTLEKLVVQLAKWANFDLKGFSHLEGRGDDSEDDGKRKTRQRTATSSKSKLTSSWETRRNRPRSSKGGKLQGTGVAKKSTGGISRNKRAVVKEESEVGDVVDYSDYLATSHDLDDDNGLSQIKVEKVEIIPDDDDNPSFIFGDIFFNGGGGGSDPEDFINPLDDDYQPPNDPQDEVNNTSSDNEMEENKPKAPRRSMAARLWRYKPLYVPPPEATKELDLTVNMVNLQPSDFERMNVKLLPGRKIRATGPWPCPKCDLIFAHKVDLMMHKREHPRTKKAPREFQCPYCPRLFHHKEHYTVHVRTHTKEKPYLCFICGYACKSAGLLNLHTRNQHSEEPREKVKCDQCPLEFQTKASFKRHHLKNHTENGRNELAAKCNLCDLVLADNGKLKRHVLDVHEDKRTLPCPICGQMFKRPNHLKKHINRHSNPNRRRRGPQIPKPLREKGRLVGKDFMKGLDEENHRLKREEEGGGGGSSTDTDSEFMEEHQPVITEEPIEVEINHIGSAYILPHQIPFASIKMLPPPPPPPPLTTTTPTTTTTSSSTSTIDHSIVKELRMDFIR